MGRPRSEHVGDKKYLQNFGNPEGGVSINMILKSILRK